MAVVEVVVAMEVVVVEVVVPPPVSLYHLAPHGLYPVYCSE